MKETEPLTNTNAGRKQDLILGIWDGHDSGVAIIENGNIRFALNEERLSRRKLEVGFPRKSFQAMCAYLGIKPREISHVAISTSDPSKTLGRIFPSLKEEYYLTRRRKKTPGMFTALKKQLKYPLTEFPTCALTRAISAQILRRQLADLGVIAPLEIIDHHAAHAASALCSSGFEDALVVTLDGIGDGLSGTIWSFRDRQFRLISQLSGKNSLGIFFEHVTNILHMRELEDEGKVMALANFTFPVPDRENPLLSLFQVNDLNLRSQYSGLSLYRELERIYYSYPSEQFAYFAQRTLEVKVIELITNALKLTGHRNLAYAGGLAANVKVNMLINELPEISELFVFPHMGDGGLAAGAALWHSFRAGHYANERISHVYLGPSFASEFPKLAMALAHEHGYQVTECPDIAQTVAQLISQGEIVLWYQGQMEFGPRSLGARSILALPNSIAIKDSLNLRLKKRCWYQPFCPSILEEEASSLLMNPKSSPNRFMTCAYRVNPDKYSHLQGAMNVDGTCRPQVISRSDNTIYSRLLCHVKQETGTAAVLNTSFNIHGEPIVCHPSEAIKTLQKAEIDYLALGDFLIKRPIGDT